MIVRKAKLQDVKELAILWIEYFNELNKNDMNQEIAVTVARSTIESIIKEGIPTFVIEANRKIIGFIIVDITGRKAKITNIYIKREKRGYGYGKALVEHIEKAFKDKKNIVLEAYTVNKKSLGFFINCGFKEIDENIVLKQILR
ncbi:MAG: GNAT family N-acetyltransferase [Candidatus Asgardarchaeia archaeon]